MKNSILNLLFFVALCGNSIYAQEKLVTRTGNVSFSSETPIENIEAKSSQAASIFEVSKKVIAFNVLMKSFKFEKALMEEHFNEKYVHSDKYPAAKFKGTYDADIDLNTPKKYENVTITGTMHFHGVSKPMTVTADIEVLENKTMQLMSDFKIVLSEYNVEIPSLVKDKIASDIAVNLVANYK